jgi:hypothetical protein
MNGDPAATDASGQNRSSQHLRRVLKRYRLYVIWECWHHGVAYDPARHRGLQRLLAAKATGADQAA